jgi:hypothetical protein
LYKYNQQKPKDMSYKIYTIAPVERSFRHNGVIKTAKMNAYDDAFYEIVEGEYKGNLVHVWDIV